MLAATLLSPVHAYHTLLKSEAYCFLSYATKTYGLTYLIDGIVDRESSYCSIVAASRFSRHRVSGSRFRAQAVDGRNPPPVPASQRHPRRRRRIAADVTIIKCPLASVPADQTAADWESR